MRKRIEVVSSDSISTTRLKLWQKTWSIVAAQVDHAVDGVHAHGGETAAGGLVAVRAPMRGLEGQCIGEGHCRLDMQDGAEVARPHALAQLGHLRMEAAVIAEPQGDTGLADGCDRVFRVFPRQCERLFAEHVLVGFRRGDHLRGVQRMRGGEHHRVDLAVGQQGVVARREPQALGLGEGLDLRRHGAGRAGDETDLVARFRQLHQRLAPPAEPDNRCFEHASSPIVIFLGAPHDRPCVAATATTQQIAHSIGYSYPSRYSEAVRGNAPTLVGSPAQTAKD